MGSTHLKQLRLIVSRINAISIHARRTDQLPSIDINGRQRKRAVAPVRVLPVLPLDDAGRTGRVGWVGDGAVVGFFVVAVVGEGVGDAGVVGLGEFFAEGVVEALDLDGLVLRH